MPVTDNIKSDMGEIAVFGLRGFLSPSPGC